MEITNIFKTPIPVEVLSVYVKFFITMKNKMSKYDFALRNTEIINTLDAEENPKMII